MRTGISNLRPMEGYFDWAACGTTAQYRKHLRHGIPVCERCRAAESARCARWRAKQDIDVINAKRRAYRAANREKVNAHQRAYRACRI